MDIRINWLVTAYASLTILGLSGTNPTLADIYWPPDSPTYEGNVSSITSPINVRLRPHSAAPGRIVVSQIYGQKLLSETKFKQSLEAVSGGYAIKRVDITGATYLPNEEKKGAHPGLALTINLGEDGHFKNVKATNEGVEIPSEGLSPFGTDPIINYFAFPTEGFQQGQDFMIELPPHNNGEVTFVRERLITVVGKTIYKTRPTIVFRTSGSTSVQNQKMLYISRGYKLLDITTGQWVMSEYQLRGLRVTEVLDLSKAKFEKDDSNSDIQSRLEAVKSLLAKGLITEDEASKKRQEILSGL
jgi:hypothetical protein